MRLTADDAAVRQAIEASRRFSGRAFLPDEFADRLALVAEEWVSNILEHGAAEPASTIVVRLAGGAQRVRLVVSDAGQPFDPRTLQFVAPNAERGGGAGVALMLAWCAIADYRRRQGRNRLVMVLEPR